MDAPGEQGAALAGWLISTCPLRSQAAPVAGPTRLIVLVFSSTTCLLPGVDRCWVFWIESTPFGGGRRGVSVFPP
jgi:hypothetical protein